MITVERFHQKLINKNIKNFVVQFANQFVDYVSDKKKQNKENYVSSDLFFKFESIDREISRAAINVVVQPLFVQ